MRTSPRELHDDVSQRLSLLEILFFKMSAEGSPAKDVETFQSVRREVQALNNDVRQISHRLHPAILKDLGLSAALKSLVEEFGEREGMPASFSVQNMPGSWPESAATALYRIAQEALRNVAKHAGKTHVKLLLRGADRSLELKVMDSGVGFDHEAAEVHKEGLA